MPRKSKRTAVDVMPPTPSPTARSDSALALSAPQDFPVIGIGASAGGLAAFKAFFAALPAEAAEGMAFVLVQHLAPDRDSLLADLLARHTGMPVREAEDGMPIRPGCIHVIPPNRDMALLNGSLQLLELATVHGLPTSSSAPWPVIGNNGPSASCSPAPAVTVRKVCGR